jgi:hypothetical protein
MIKKKKIAWSHGLELARVQILKDLQTTKPWIGASHGLELP